MSQIPEDAVLELLVETLSPTPVAVDELVRQCHLSAASLPPCCSNWDSQGASSVHPGNLVSQR
jgi:hypothetical protein